MGWEPLQTNLDDQELLQLASFLRGWKVDEDAIEYGLEVLFDAGRYELAEPSREKLIQLMDSKVEIPFSGQIQ